MQDRRIISKVIPWQGLVVWLILGLVFSGCADLSAIRQFSTSSTEAENYTRIIDDSVNIQERMKYYQAQKDIADFEKFKKEMEQLKPGLLALNKVVSAYMKALGDLASDEVISYNTPLNNLKGEVENSSLVKGGLVTKQTVDAFAALAELISKAATDAYRRNKIQEVIGKANTPIQTILSDQKKIVEGYKLYLILELTYVRAYYGQIITKLDVFSKKEKDEINKSKNYDEAMINHLGFAVWNSPPRVYPLKRGRL